MAGGPHHTTLLAEYAVDGTISHTGQAHNLAAAGAVVLTFLAIFFALATRAETLQSSGQEHGE